VAESADSRRSIRAYTPDAISADAIHDILRLAGRAPSAWNLQPWRWIVVTDADVKNKLMGAAYGQPQVGAAPVLLVLTSDMDDTLANVDNVLPAGMTDEAKAGLKGQILGALGGLPAEIKAGWGVGQANIALGYLLLVLESLGYASSPMLGFVPDQVREILGLGAHVQIPALIAFGIPGGEGYPSHRHAVESITRTV
jgi:nitroreductase